MGTFILWLFSYFGWLYLGCEVFQIETQWLSDLWGYSGLAICLFIAVIPAAIENWTPRAGFVPDGFPGWWNRQ